MKKSKIYLIENDKDIVYIDPNTQRMVKCENNESNKKIISKIILNEEVENNKNYDDIGIFLMISQVCNLNCKYCYADQGDYGKRKGYLDENNARKIIDFLFDNYNLKYIQFFGGEPTLNVNIIEYIINYINEKVRSGRGINYPFYSIVTNLIENTEKLCELVKKHNIAITVSLDGDSFLQNKLRPLQNGKSSYDILKKNYMILLENNIKPFIELTYTGIHQNYTSLEEIYDFLNSNFENSGIFLTSVVNCRKLDELYFDKDIFQTEKENMMLKIMDSMCTDKPIFSREIINNLKKIITDYKNNYYICRNAPGVKQFTIDIDGDIYPCYCLSGDKRMRFGNIKEIKKDDITKKQKIYERINKNNSICQNCGYKSLCSVCLADEYFSSDNGSKFGDINLENCTRRRSYYNKLIYKYIEIINDDNKKTIFLKNFLRGLNS